MPNDEEYFTRLEAEKTAKLKEKLSAERTLQEREKLRVLHHQRCGKCGGEMLPRGFRGVEIDVCADCDAVLLDPGELQQLAGEDRSGFVSDIVSFFRTDRS